MKGFCLHFAKQGLLYSERFGDSRRAQSLLRETFATPLRHTTHTSGLFHFSAFSFKLDQTSEVTFRYQRSRYSDEDAPKKKRPVIKIYGATLLRTPAVNRVSSAVKWNVKLACVWACKLVYTSGRQKGQRTRRQSGPKLTRREKSVSNGDLVM